MIEVREGETGGSSAVGPTAVGHALQRLAERLDAERHRRAIALQQEAASLSPAVAAQPEAMARAILRRVGIRPLVRALPMLAAAALLLPTGEAHADPVRATAVGQAHARIISASAQLRGAQFTIMATGAPAPQDGTALASPATSITTIGEQHCDDPAAAEPAASACIVTSFDLP